MDFLGRGTMHDEAEAVLKRVKDHGLFPGPQLRL